MADFDPQADDLRLPEIPDPQQPDAGGDDADMALREMEHPELVRHAQQAEQPEPDLTFGESVEAIKAADASPLEKAPDVSAPPIDLPHVGSHGPGFSSEISAIVGADKPEKPLAAGPAAREAAGGQRAAADAGAVPANFEEFQQAIAGMKRADGQPWHPNAVANMYRRYRELGIDNGLEPPAGQEQADLHLREGEQGFAKADRARLNVQTDLLRLLTQASVENMRELTQLKDTLLRSRH